MKKISAILAAVLALSACHSVRPVQNSFVQRSGTHFMLDGKPYYFVGTNFWYGAILGSTGEGGNRARLLRELDSMQRDRIVNLRVLVGADGLSGEPFRVQPTLQTAPGVYNDTLFDGLDFLMSELGKRKMHAVLYLNNSWEWSGGYSRYLEWAGRGKGPEAGDRDWPAYRQYAAQYALCDSCRALFFDHIRHVVSRTNRYTGLKYTDDPALMAWQIGNEPRAFDDAAKPAFVAWLHGAAALIRSLDKNHLICTGSEGVMGTENDMALYERIHADSDVDYLTIHIWPKNWGWTDSATVMQSLDSAILKTDRYIAEHLAVAQALDKPLVIEEFGYPRDHHRYAPDDPTTARDRYYAHILARVVASAANDGTLAGCNFWAWGGEGRPAHLFWQPGDDYLGDPAQEQQGLNAVFDTDATMDTLKTYTEQITFNPNKS